MLTVSVVMATFNGDQYLQSQLDSLARQIRLPDELVVCDDLSNDKTPEIVSHFAKSAPFAVKLYVNDARLNFRMNFFKAASAASCELIMFCDQDDIWLPHKIKTMVRFFEENEQILLAYHGAEVVSVDGTLIGHVSDHAREQTNIGKFPSAPWAFARGLLQTFRSDLRRFDDLIAFSREHFSNDVLAHDRWYFFLASALGAIAYVPDNLVQYRQHGSNAFGADRDDGWRAKIISKFAHDADSDFYAAMGARSRADVLERILALCPIHRQASILDLANLYRRYAERLDRRRGIYTELTVIKRFVGLAQALCCGDYMGRPWAFSPFSIVRDLYLGVFLHRPAKVSTI